MPVWQAVRPASRSLSVSQGKGVSHTSAVVGAVMEAAELWHAERLPTSPVRHATDAEAALWAQHLIDGSAPVLDGPLSWIEGRDILGGGQLAVPRAFLSLDYTEPAAGPFSPISTGLSAGNTADDALLAALCEVAERRLLTINLLSASLRERVERGVDPATVTDRRCSWVIRKITEARLAFRISDLGDGDDLPAFAVTILGGERGHFAVRPTTGSAAHPVAERALLGALLEAVQIRVTLLAGARDDLRQQDYAQDWVEAGKMASRLRLLAGAGQPPVRPFRSRPRPASIQAACEQMLGIFDHWRALAVVVVDHSRPEVGIPVLKVIVPGCPDSERTRS